MIFVKSTDSITTLNRLLAADTGASLDEAVLATDKDDTEYCVDLFQAIRNSAHSASPEELDNARKALVLRGKLDSSDYLIIERECSKAHAVQSMDLRGVAAYSVPALSIITTTLQRHFSEEVALSSFDMSGSMIPAADGRSGESLWTKAARCSSSIDAAASTAVVATAGAGATMTSEGTRRHRSHSHQPHM